MDLLESRQKNPDKNPSHIGFRVWELAALQQEKGLKFETLSGYSGVMIVSNSDIQVKRVSFDQLPKEQKELLLEKKLNWEEANCVHLKSTGNVKKELGVSFIFSNKVNSGDGSVKMIRTEGGGKLDADIPLNKGVIFFIVANEVSLTAKTGTLNDLLEAGVEIDLNWENCPVSMLQ